MTNLSGNFLFGLFLGFCLGAAVFPVGLLIREIMITISSIRRLPPGCLDPTLDPRYPYRAPRPNRRKTPEEMSLN